jgi:hypothetical protein
MMFWRPSLESTKTPHFYGVACVKRASVQSQLNRRLTIQFFGVSDRSSVAPELCHTTSSLSLARRT